MKKKTQKRTGSDILRFWKNIQDKSDNKIKNHIDISVERAKKEFSEESHRHMSILSEDFQGRVVAIGEQLGDFRKDLSEMRDDISGMKETLNSHTEMIGEVAVDVEIVKKNVEFLKGGLKKKVDYDEFLALERRITLLESKTK